MTIFAREFDSRVAFFFFSSIVKVALELGLGKRCPLYSLISEQNKVIKESAHLENTVYI